MTGFAVLVAAPHARADDDGAAPYSDSCITALTMTDAAPPADAPANGSSEAPAAPGLRILAQFVRDLSFENPRAPQSLRTEGKPAIDLGVEMNAQGRPDGLFEVDLKLSVRATQDGAAVFQVELLYGGLFQLVGVDEQAIEPMLLIEAPRYLFPYAREILSRATADGGFHPPFMIEPIDFAMIYAQRREQIARGPAETGQA